MTGFGRDEPRPPSCTLLRNQIGVGVLHLPMPKRWGQRICSGVLGRVQIFWTCVKTLNWKIAPDARILRWLWSSNTGDLDVLFTSPDTVGLSLSTTLSNIRFGLVWNAFAHQADWQIHSMGFPSDSGRQRPFRGFEVGAKERVKIPAAMSGVSVCCRQCA